MALNSQGGARKGRVLLAALARVLTKLGCRLRLGCLGPGGLAHTSADVRVAGVVCHSAGTLLICRRDEANKVWHGNFVLQSIITN